VSVRGEQANMQSDRSDDDSVYHFNIVHIFLLSIPI
jgi:hypothetical protein